MGRIPINGVHLNVVMAGHGPVVVALHGFTGSIETWESFFAAARGRYTVVAVDLLGHGASDSPADPVRYRMERCVEDLEALLDSLGVRRAHWLGYSMGGRMALSVAIALPHRTLSLVAEAASPGLATDKERTARSRSDAALADWLQQVGIERFVEHWESLPLFASQRDLPAPVRTRLHEQRLRNNPLGLANSLRSVGAGAQPPLYSRLSTLEAPALFIAGEKDAKFVALARQMHGAVPRGSLRLIGQAGHAAHLEQPGEFNKAVLEFLEGCQEANLAPRARGAPTGQHDL